MDPLFIEILKGICSLIFKVLELVVHTFTRQRKLKRILSFKKNKRTLILPLRKGVLNGVVETKNYISDEVEAVAGIIEMLLRRGYSTHVNFEKEMYRRLKKHRDHYFVVCEYCRDFGMNFERWEDLTDVMFSA